MVAEAFFGKLDAGLRNINSDRLVSGFIQGIGQIALPTTYLNDWIPT